MVEKKQAEKCCSACVNNMVITQCLLFLLASNATDENDFNTLIFRFEVYLCCACT